MARWFLALVLFPATAFAAAPATEFFDVLGTGLKEWRLAFRGTANIGKSVYKAYVNGSNIPAVVMDGCRTTDWSQLCDTHYRNADALDRWANILEVLFVIVDGGHMVKTVKFNGAGTTYLNWFSESHQISSSWPDLKGNRPHFYAIQGDNLLERRFFINHNYGGCPADSGWVVAVDRANVACDWEKDKAFPVFKYAAGDKFENWNTGNFRDADAIAIFVKYSGGSSVFG